MQNKPSVLVDAICDNFMMAVNHGIWAPELIGTNWITHCNSFVYAVSTRMGYKGFWDPYRKAPMMANAIVDLMKQEIEWMKEKDGNMAQFHANTGALVIAGQKGEIHGHICVIRPGEMSYSGKWGKPVPRCGNVGKDVFIDKGINFAFETEPEYFVLKEMLV